MLSSDFAIALGVIFSANWFQGACSLLPIVSVWGFLGLVAGTNGKLRSSIGGISRRSDNSQTISMDHRRMHVTAWIVAFSSGGFVLSSYLISPAQSLDLVTIHHDTDSDIIYHSHRASCSFSPGNTNWSIAWGLAITSLVFMILLVIETTTLAVSMGQWGVNRAKPFATSLYITLIALISISFIAFTLSGNYMSIAILIRVAVLIIAAFNLTAFTLSKNIKVGSASEATTTRFNRRLTGAMMSRGDSNLKTKYVQRESKLRFTKTISS